MHICMYILHLCNIYVLMMIFICTIITITIIIVVNNRNKNNNNNSTSSSIKIPSILLNCCHCCYLLFLMSFVLSLVLFVIFAHIVVGTLGSVGTALGREYSTHKLCRYLSYTIDNGALLILEIIRTLHTHMQKRLHIHAIVIS